MTKYNDEFKLMNLNGRLGYRCISQRHGINQSILKRWVKTYQVFGVEGLKRKQRKTSYPVQFKVNVLHFKKQTGASYSDTAITFGMNNPSLIANWNRAFLENGAEGLKEKAKGVLQ